MNTKEIDRLMAADEALAGDGSHIFEFAARHKVSDKTVRRLLDFIQARFRADLTADDNWYWTYSDRRFRIFTRKAAGE